MTDRASYGAVEDRTMPAVVYALFLIGIANGLTVLIGLVIALASRGGAGARMHCSRSVQFTNSKSIQKPSGERVAGWFAKEWLKVNEALARGIASFRHKPRSRFLCLRFARPRNDHN